MAEGLGVTSENNRSWVVWLLVLLPAWLVVSSGIGLWIWWKGEKAGEKAEPVKFTTPISADRLADDVRKLVDYVGVAGIANEEKARGLRSVSAMIEGSLGLSNAGYRVDLRSGPETARGEWPIILATLPGDEREPLWVVTGYDSAVANPIEGNATGVAAVLALAQALAGERVGRPVTFAFVPHAFEEEAPVMAAMDLVARWAEGAETVLWVEAMGAGEELLVSSRDVEQVARAEFPGHATVVGAEAICLADDFDAASVLFEMGLPAVRVATRRVVGEDEKPARPDPETHAASTRKLVELVRELAK